jgi:transposase
MPKGQPFSGEFKQKVIEDMLNNGLSYRETAKKYGLPNHEPVRKWERIYRTEGVDGLYVDRRGRKSTGRPAKLSKEVEKDLMAENQRLRMEIDYLKKLNALVLKEEQQNRKRK